MKRCFNTVVLEPSMHNEGGGGDDYGIAIANSQTIKVNGGDVYSRRHAISTGGDAQPGAVPCRDIRVTNMTLSNDIESGTHCADFHGNTEDSSYSNCEIYGGATWQGKNNGFIDCRIGSLKTGVCILAAEILGGNHFARGCSFHTVTNPRPSNRAIIDVGGNSAAVDANTVEDCTFEVTQSRIFARNLANNVSLLNMRNRGSNSKLNYIVDGLEIDADDYGNVLLTSDDGTGTADSDFIIVDNIRNLNGLTGKTLCSHSGGAYLNVPQRMQKQTGAETVTSSTSSPTVTGTPVTFKWKYPRTPVVTIARNNRGYLSNRIGIAYANSLGTDGLTPTISTDDATNFGSAVTVELHWQAEIAEV